MIVQKNQRSASMKHHFSFYMRQEKKRMKSQMPQEPADGMLIKRYVEGGDEKAFELLMQRHYKMTYHRFLKNTQNPDHALDLTQQLWMQMVRHLSSYQDEGKFPSYLMLCASNLLTDFWRRKGVRNEVMVDLSTDEQQDMYTNVADPYANTEADIDLNQQIDFLTSRLIPALPCEQRLVFLIKHESEYWEEKKRLSWKQLAQLNGLDEDKVWEYFERVRNNMLCNTTGGEAERETSCDAILIFLVWSQAQRVSKKQDYTWGYFAKILNIPENTLKTRYRAALKTLADGLTELNQ